MNISIIIPVFNGEKTIKRAIRSVLKQNEKELEVIVIDNGSTDRTKSIIKKIKQNDQRVKYYHLEEKGRSKARNIGISKSSGKYIKFLDADDELFSDSLRRELQFLENNDYFAYISNIIYVNDSNEKEYEFKIPQVNYKHLLVNNYFPINSVLFRNGKNNKFDNSLDYNEDWLFWAEIFENEKIYIDNSFVSGIVHIHENNTMSNKKKMSEFGMLIRTKLKKKRSGSQIFYLVKDIKELTKYLLISNRNSCIEEQIKVEYTYLYNIILLCLKFKLLNKIIVKSFRKREKKNRIVYGE